MKRYIILLIVLLTCGLSMQAQSEMEVTGNVTDNRGEPLIGVNVIVKGVTGLGTLTDLDGNYKIKVKEYQTLVFSYIGFETQEVTVKPSNRRIDMKLNEAVLNAVDEVVVTGMGAMKRLTVTGAVTNVDVDDLKHFSSSNVSNMLAGNVPGIIAMQTSGQPGKNTSEFWIRGISTFGAGRGAYILVDGFERSNLDDLNIEDIESFSVLKDASATAIYGSKGANGVILITTKHGKEGKISINGKFESSYNTRTITPEFVDGLTYASLVNEANVTRNRGIVYQPYEFELFRSGVDPDMYPNVDWTDLILKNGAWSYRGNLNISGGGSTARYYASVSYVEDEGMYKTDKTLRDKYNTNANYKRWNYRLNVDIDITPTTVLKLGVSGDLSMRNSPGMGDDYAWSSLFGYNAILQPALYSNGYVPIINAMRSDQRSNPWVMTTQTGYNENWNNNLQSNVTLEQDLKFILPGLKFTGRFGYDTYNNNNIYKRQLPDMWSMFPRTPDAIESFDHIISRQDMTQWSDNDGSRRQFLDLLLHWDQAFKDKHYVGANLKYTFDESIQTQNIGDDIKNSISRKNLGLAGQVTYNFKRRYFLDYNFGYNGSENFSDGHRFGFFPAYSVAWNVAEEPWIRKKFDKWLDMFKIRYSHGKVGNDYSSTRFPYLYTIGYGNEGVYNFGTNDSPTRPAYQHGLHYTQLASPNVTWEVATKDDIGVDFVLFNNRFSLTLDYFKEKRTGIFMERRFLAYMFGLESNPWANVGAVKQQGFDGNFKYEDKFGDVGVTVRGNITYSKNTILDYDVEENVYPYQYTTGYRVDQVRGLIAEGLFKDYDDIRNSPKQMFGDVQPGDIKYKDVNGDGVVDDGDVVAIGATRTPNLIYGLGLSVTYKGFDVNLHFQGAGKCTFPIDGKCVYAFNEGSWGQIFTGLVGDRYIDAETASMLGIAANENPNATYPRLSYGGNSNNYRTSTFWLRDGRYLRLKNFDLGYTLPKSIVNSLHMNSVRVYIQGTNLFTWSKFKTWDPELGSSNGEAYPITKAITAGIQVNL